MRACAARSPARLALLTVLGMLAVVLWLWSCQGAGPPASPPLAGGPRAEPDVRVRLRAGMPVVRIEAPGRVRLRAVGGSEATLTTPIEITPAGPGVRALAADGSAALFDFPATLVCEGLPDDPALSRHSPTAPGPIRVDGLTLAGSVRVLAHARAGLDLIEVVPLETYLASVVSAELPATFPLDACRVQAVCARTYALHERQRAASLGRPWDLEATEQDQVYRPGMTTPQARAAVADTRGVVLTWQGRLLRAYYSSTCGGRPASAADTWPTGPGYEFNLAQPLQATPRPHACQASPAYRWTVTRQLAALSEQMRQWGRAAGHPVRAMGTLTALAPARLNLAGRPAAYTITDSGGTTFTISAEALRLACNYVPPGATPLPRDARVRSGDMEFDLADQRVTIRGRGFGHGVGMCQFCVAGLAATGRPWHDIVLLFYPGAVLERAY